MLEVDESPGAEHLRPFYPSIYNDFTTVHARNGDRRSRRS
jgi:hypothetical protein